MDSAKFQGSSSISSDDYFGNGQQSNRGAGSGYGNYNTPDIQEIKDGVKQGVTKVAGKLSNLASGVMSSLQVLPILLTCQVVPTNSDYQELFSLCVKTLSSHAYKSSRTPLPLLG